jgi:fructose-1,6-bisphosphatase II
MQIPDILDSLKSVTEYTAIHVFPEFGKGDKNKADHIAVEAMREALSKQNFISRVIIGEGEKDEAPMLYEDEVLGNGNIQIDLAVDPLECTSNFAKGLMNSLSVIAFAEKGKLKRVPGTYMEQWIAGPKMKYAFDPNSSVHENIEKLSASLNKKPEELLIVVQDRERHELLIKELRKMKCGISLIDSGSLTCILDICLENGNFDALIGTYGAPEGLIGAIVASLTNSEMKGILRPHDEKNKLRWEELGGSHGDIMDKNDFINTENSGFVATCISSNHLMKGIQREKNGYSGTSLVISKNKFEIKKFFREKP